MSTQVVLICAESNMLAAARRAAAAVPDLHLSAFLAHEVHLRADEVQRALQRADAAIVSMVNVDADAMRLSALLHESSPGWVFPIHSQPELIAALRLGGRDVSFLQNREGLVRVVRALEETGIRCAPVAAAVLAMLPRTLHLMPTDEVLAALRPYAVVGALWQQASEGNLIRLFEYLAGLCTDSAEPPLPAVDVQPVVALWHPAAPDLFTETRDYLDWYEEYLNPRHPGTSRRWTGVILFRQLVLSGDTEVYREVIEALEAKGLAVIAGFAGLDNTPLLREHFRTVGVDLLLNLTGFNLVGAMGHPNPQAAISLLRELDVPYLVASPLLFQTRDEWEADPLGLSPTQTALQVVLPELEGGIDPRVIGGRTSGDRMMPHAEQVERLAQKVLRWITLRNKPAAERRLAITLFSFPPDKGAVGTAAYLDVFASVHALLVALDGAGYDVGDLPATPEQLLDRLLGGKGADPLSRGSATPYTWISPGEYRRLVPYASRLQPSFGEPPGQLDTDGRRIAIRGIACGNVFIGLQPGFGYEGDPMRLLFSPDASPSHSFAAYYAWLQQGWEADAILHFGTHGALEFMPGKQTGLTVACYPELLIGDLPNLYYYSLNNPSEASIAKRRGGAVTVSYLSPPLSAAGLYRELRELQERIERWYAAGPAEREERFAEVLEAASSAHFDAELQRAGLTLELIGGAGRKIDTLDQEAWVDELRAALREIEGRLIPIGLHVAGAPLRPEARAAFLRAEAERGRAEEGVRPLVDVLSSAFEPNEAEALQDALIAAIAAHPNAAREQCRMLLPLTLPAALRAEIEVCIEHLITFADTLEPRHELPALLGALEGRYVPPSPGGDPARSPEVLPSGRNIHALDPYRIPSHAATAAARQTVDGLLERLRAENGEYPESVAMVLWGTDNIKTGGEGVAQALHFLGVEAVPDSLGRKTRLRLIPLHELDRPRVDVVMTVSGIFRDLFPTVLELLDRAVRMAATADEPPEMNFVRRKTLRLAEELRVEPTVASARIFSNAAGRYGTGVNHVVEASDWHRTEDLAELFLERKGFVYGLDLRGEAEQELFAAALRGVGATVQNLDSAEIGPTDVDHYFEYLGGLTAAVEAVGGAPVPAFLVDPLEKGAPARPLDEMLRLDVRTRLLNPTWYEALLRHGYQGVSEIASRLDHVFGWSATTRSVDAWVYQLTADRYLLDERMQERLSRLNPHAVQRITERLLEANARGFWRADDERLNRLQSLSDRFVAELEGLPAGDLPSEAARGTGASETVEVVGASKTTGSADAAGKGF